MVELRRKGNSRLVPPLKTALIDAYENAHRIGLKQARAALRAGLAGADKTAPAMAELLELNVDGGAGPLPARLYRPAGAPSGAPLIVYFHGGGFVLGDLDTNEGMCKRIAATARLPLLAVDYRLAPDAPFPAQIEDALAATRWAHAHAAELGCATDGVVIGGDSAGAYMAITAARQLNAAQPGTVIAQLLIYPLIHVDDADWSDTVLTDTRVLGRAAVSMVRIHTGPNGPASILDHADPATPPTFICYGSHLDPVRPDARRYAQRLINAGVKVVEKEFALLPHGFANMGHVAPVARDAVAEIGRLAGDLIRWTRLRAAEET